MMGRMGVVRCKQPLANQGFAGDDVEQSHYMSESATLWFHAPPIVL